MNEILFAAIFGAIGAIVRVLIIALQLTQLKQKVQLTGYLIYVIVVIAVGAFSGIVLSYGKVLSFLAGYAGLDLIEGYYKVFKKKKITLK